MKLVLAMRSVPQLARNFIKTDKAKALMHILMWVLLYAIAIFTLLYTKNYIERVKDIYIFGGYSTQIAFAHAYNTSILLYYLSLAGVVGISILSLFIAPKIISGTFALAAFVGVQAILANYLILSIEKYWIYLVAAFIVIGLVFFVAKNITTAFFAWIITSPIFFYFMAVKFAQGLPKISFDRVAIFLFCFSIAISVFGQKIKLRKPNIAELFFIIFTVYACINTVFIHGIRDTGLYQNLFDFIISTMIIYFITKSCLKTKKDLTIAIACLCIVGFIGSALLLMESQTGYKWTGLIIGRRIPLDWTDVGEGRGQGLWGIPHTTQIFCVITIFLSLHMGFNVKKLFTKIFYFAAVAVMAAAIFFAYSRTGYIALALGIIIMPFFVPKDKFKYAMLPVIVLISLALALPSFLSQSDFMHRMTVDTISVRKSINQTNIALIQDNPLFGVGYDQVPENFRNYVANLDHWHTLRNNIQILQKPHNWHLQVIGEEGFVGAFFYYASIICFLIYSFSLSKRLPNNGILGANLPMIIFVVSLVMQISLNFYGGPKDPYPIYVTWMIFALVVRLYELNSERIIDKKIR